MKPGHAKDRSTMRVRGPGARRLRRAMGVAYMVRRSSWIAARHRRGDTLHPDEPPEITLER